MNIFISWSGERSKLVGNLINDWLKMVIQAASPWISTNDIGAGASWNNYINDQLTVSKFGIICITKENKEKPWILFEAGAIAKGLRQNNVATLLIDITGLEVGPPLSQFNHTEFNKESMRRLLKTINESLEANQLDDKTLDSVFESNWQKLYDDFTYIISKTQAIGGDSNRSQIDISNETLNSVRSIDKRIAKIEENLKLSTTAGKDEGSIGWIICKQIHHMVGQGVDNDEIERYLLGSIGLSEKWAKYYLYHAYPKNYQEYLKSIK